MQWNSEAKLKQIFFVSSRSIKFKNLLRNKCFCKHLFLSFRQWSHEPHNYFLSKHSHLTHAPNFQLRSNDLKIAFEIITFGFLQTCSNSSAGKWVKYKISNKSEQVFFLFNNNQQEIGQIVKSFCACIMKIKSLRHLTGKSSNKLETRWKSCRNPTYMHPLVHDKISQRRKFI